LADNDLIVADASQNEQFGGISVQIRGLWNHS